jgi:hypothetical protein
LERQNKGKKGQELRKKVQREKGKNTRNVRKGQEKIVKETSEWKGKRKKTGSEKTGETKAHNNTN